MTNDNKLNEEKISLALEKKIKLHITLKNGVWRNGFVKEISSDFFIFVDDVTGQQSVFFMEVQKAEPYMNEERGEENERR